MKALTAVAISGGIDSLYSARSLMDSGHTLTGVHFITGYESAPAETHPLSSGGAEVISHCTAPEDTIRAMEHISAQLRIPIHIIDLSHVFQKNVVDYFTSEYRMGRTPNPCLVCNPAVKFGALLEFAESIGADKIATGHYVRTRTDASGHIHLVKGKDPAKDQSYFLAMLTAARLEKALFPLGDKTKEEIKSEAAEKGLTPVSKSESQDICFIPGGDYKAFLASRKGFSSRPGDIVTLEGKTIGKHKGLHSFTVGQRRGINCPGPAPYYVVGLDTAANKLVVGFKDDLLTKECKVTHINWINGVPDGPVRLETKVRYSHKGVLSTITPLPDGCAHITFDQPQPAVTPGQGAVFYDGDEVTGGGFIE